MYIKYTPAVGEEPQELYFQLAKLMSVEAEKIEEITGWSFEEFQTRLVKGFVKARRVLLWVLLKRTHPSLKLADLDVPVDAIVMEFDRDEFDAMIEAMRKAEASEQDEAKAAEMAQVIATFEELREAAPEPQDGPKGGPPVSGDA